MKRLHFKLFACLSLLSLVVACDVVTSSSSSSSSTSTSSSVSVSTSSTTNIKTNEDFEHAKTTYVKDGKEYNLNMNTLYTNQNHPHLDPLEEQHVLVVPFGFTDYERVQTKENRDRIEKTFFGTQEEIDEVGGWVSVADYYNRSSFGKSTFKGKVVPNWCIYEGTSNDFLNANGSGLTAARYVRSWYANEYAKEGHGSLGADAEPLTYFDQNGDGYLDLVWVVYSVPYKSDTTWWAYVTYDQSPIPNKDFPTVNTLGWASINFMDDGYNGYDAHTFVHETGHTYGLDDYYDYSNSWAPMGGIDMMDHNLGDHSAFSKFCLGWLSPLVVDDTATITLRPTATTGDCFIIPSPNYNGTAFDEYMMVEFMAPVGLAEKDYKNGYKLTNGYSQSGIRISHVDARVVQSATLTAENYLTNNPEDGYDYRVCNTKGGRSGTDTNYYPVEENGKISWNPYSLSMIFESNFDEKNNVTTSKGSTASNSSLFGRLAKFSLESNDRWAKVFMPSKSNLWNKSKTMTGGTLTNQKYTIDEKCTFDYRIDVTRIASDNSSATIKVTKIR